jgi:hypothetical protein
MLDYGCKTCFAESNYRLFYVVGGGRRLD